MKKVLSVAMASAMVLGMGANAFAISYSTGSNDKADWPKNFEFEGSLFVTNEDGDIVTSSTTLLNENEEVDFMAGDVIWMPLYADDQVSYSADYTEATKDKVGVNDIKINDGITKATKTAKKLYFDADTSKWYEKKGDTTEFVFDDYTTANGETPDYSGYYTAYVTDDFAAAAVVVPETVDVKVGDNWESRKVSSVKYVVDGRTYSGSPAKVQEQLNKLFAEKDSSITATDVDAYKYGYSISGTATVKAEDGEDATVNNPVVDDTKDGVVLERGLYTGKIDKNWSINLIEDTKGVAELIEKVELYKATKYDYASYEKYADIQPNAVFVRVHLKDEWKSAKDETLKYHVYVANNAGKQTNKVWVEGTYAGMSTTTVNFDWTNDASVARVWEAKENGTAVFDFADKAFFTVKMYKGEKLYLDMSSAFDKTADGDLNYTADSFYKFVDGQGNNNFYREGELVLVNDNEDLVVYNITEEGYEVVDAEYVENKEIAKLGKKVNGFVFSTKQLGNYVVAEEIEEEVVEEEVEDVVEEEPTEDVEDVVVDEVETDKPNPETGAEDFVGLAVSLAVVSVAAAGALALKK